jgi:hypothetical protein
MLVYYLVSEALPLEADSNHVADLA